MGFFQSEFSDYHNPPFGNRITKIRTSYQIYLKMLEIIDNPKILRTMYAFIFGEATKPNDTNVSTFTNQIKEVDTILLDSDDSADETQNDLSILSPLQDTSILTSNNDLKEKSMLSSINRHSISNRYSEAISTLIDRTNADISKIESDIRKDEI